MSNPPFPPNWQTLSDAPSLPELPQQVAQLERALAIRIEQLLAEGAPLGSCVIGGWADRPDFDLLPVPMRSAQDVLAARSGLSRMAQAEGWHYVCLVSLQVAPDGGPPHVAPSPEPFGPAQLPTGARLWLIATLEVGQLFLRAHAPLLDATSGPPNQLATPLAFEPIDPHCSLIGPVLALSPWERASVH